MKRLAAYKADLLIVAGFLFLPLLLFADVTLGNHTMLPVDNLFQWAPWETAAATFDVEVPQNSLLTDMIVENYAWKRFILNSLRHGEIPLWNPYLFAGTPFLATGQHSGYYPFSLLFLILSLAKAYGWYTVSQLWLAGVLMYLFGRILGMRRAAATIAGLVYQGSGFLLVSATVFPMILGAAVWLPLLLGCIEMVVKTAVGSARHPLLWVALGAIALGCQILAGHIEITYYTLLIMALYAAWRLATLAWHKRQTKGGRYTALLPPAAWLLSMVLVGLMLGSVQLIPFYEVGQANFREGSATFAEVQSWAFPKRRILTLALPNFFGNPAHHHYVDIFSGETVPFTRNASGELNPRGAYSSSWGLKNYVEGGIYLGILPLFLAFLGIYAAWRRPAGKPRRTHPLFFLLLSLFSLAFIFGTPLYAILYYGLPFFNQLHTPFRWVFPLSLCVAALAGFGANYLVETQNAEQGAKREDQGAKQWRWASDREVPWYGRPFILWGKPSLVTGLAGLAFWGGGMLLTGLFASRAFYSSVEPLVARVFHGLALATDAFPHTRAFYSYQFRQIFILGLMLVATGTVLRVSRCPIFVGWRGRKRPIWELMAAVVLVLDVFLANQGFHVAVDPALLEYKPQMVQWLQAQPGHWRLTTFDPKGEQPFHANSAWLFDLQDIRGYDSIILKPYTRYMQAIEPQNGLASNRIQPLANWQSLNSPLLDVLGVKYIITTEPLELPKLQEAWAGEGVRIYENLAVAPRAYMLPVTATAVVDDALAAMTRLDPRQYVILERQDWRPPLDETIPTPQEPLSSPYDPAEIAQYSNIEVMVTADVGQPSWLVLNDSYFSGWKAFVRPYGTGEDQEQRVEIYRVSGNFRGVVLPAGHWTVRFRYSPLTFQLGGVASFIGGIILLFAVAVWGWRRYVKMEGELSAVRSMAKNSLAPMMLNLFNRAIDFVYAAFYLRVLGPADAGSFSNAIAIAMMYEILANFGLNLLLIREVSQDKKEAGHYLLNTTVLRLGTGVVGFLPVLAFMWVMNVTNNPLSAEEVTAIVFLMAGMVVSGMALGVTGLFYVYEQAETPAAITTVTTILRVTFGVTALVLGYGFVGLAAVSIFVNIITLTILAVLAFRQFPLRGPWRVDFRFQRRLLGRGYPLMLIHLLQTIFISIDVVLLRFINGEEYVGWYNSAYKWFNALQVVPSFFSLALFPIISREIQNSIAAARRMYYLSLKVMLLLALPAAAVLFYLAYPLVGLLGGAEFVPDGAIALQIVIWSIPVGWLNSVTNYMLIALGLERMQPRAFALAVCFNIVANLIFLPRYNYRAAAITTILSEVVLLVTFDYFLRQRMPRINWVGFVTRPFLVTVVMVAAMLSGGRLHMVVGLLLGLLIYPAGLWLLRVFGEEERHVLRSILPAPLAARLKLTGDAQP